MTVIDFCHGLSFLIFFFVFLVKRFEDDCLVEPFFCEKDHRLVRVEVNLNEATNTVTCGAQEILINDWCTGSNHHGGGGMDFMPNGDMMVAVGDLSKVNKLYGDLR